RGRTPLLLAPRVGRYGVEMDEPQPDENPAPDEDPLAECIRNGVYTAVGLGLLLVNRWQTARRDLAGQVPDDLREAFSDLAGQVPEDVRNAAVDFARQLPDSVRTALSDVVEQAPALAEALREFADSCSGPASEYAEALMPFLALRECADSRSEPA
ncbi:MAG: hypothetical protein OXF04_04575, partial [bacterium]|nr:hypothetical protein [bacterium]